MERNMLEAARDNGDFSTSQPSLPPANTGAILWKGKSKGAFSTFDHSDPESDGDKTSGAHAAARHSEWIKPGSTHKFPCPLQNHDHRIAFCTVMFTLTPKDRWLKIPRGCICYTCLKPEGPKGLCKNKRCAKEKGILQVLLCAACTPWAAAKGWAPFNILMCRKPERGQDRPKPADARKFSKNI